MSTPGTSFETGGFVRPAHPRSPRCLFLDAPTPDAVSVDAPLLDLLPVTDLVGFAAMKRFNGIPIAVGSRITGETRLAGPRDVRAWLECLVA